MALNKSNTSEESRLNFFRKYMKQISPVKQTCTEDVLCLLNLNDFFKQSLNLMSFRQPSQIVSNCFSDLSIKYTVTYNAFSSYEGSENDINTH